MRLSPSPRPASSLLRPDFAAREEEGREGHAFLLPSSLPPSPLLSLSLFSVDTPSLPSLGKAARNRKGLLFFRSPPVSHQRRPNSLQSPLPPFPPPKFLSPLRQAVQNGKKTGIRVQCSSEEEREREIVDFIGSPFPFPPTLEDEASKEVGERAFWKLNSGEAFCSSLCISQVK